MVFRSVIENENRRFIMGQEIMPGALKGNGLLLPFLLYAPVPLRAVGCDLTLVSFLEGMYAAACAFLSSMPKASLSDSIWIVCAGAYEELVA
ncbi:hypothetical protein HLB25_00815 [Dickeya dadantii]|uniref:hypothetical protein n=1 Tax=Dickeya dadantii TaxID=204038 RepID=UPI001496138B|nr:hypothetical protein [Dickeya dadantii]NPE53936.1 hypothetical protein [Dickeya dadantii]NPE65431.1 hypothetical protein [Dickeya dadantii]